MQNYKSIPELIKEINLNKMHSPANYLSRNILTDQKSVSLRSNPMFSHSQSST